jgi:hypothetical protein
LGSGRKDNTLRSILLNNFLLTSIPIGNSCGQGILLQLKGGKATYERQYDGVLHHNPPEKEGLREDLKSLLTTTEKCRIQNSDK